jgi:hypothetical protein
LAAPFDEAGTLGGGPPLEAWPPPPRLPTAALREWPGGAADRAERLEADLPGLELVGWLGAEPLPEELLDGATVRVAASPLVAPPRPAAAPRPLAGALSADGVGCGDGVGAAVAGASVPRVGAGALREVDLTLSGSFRPPETVASDFLRSARRRLSALCPAAAEPALAAAGAACAWPRAGPAGAVRDGSCTGVAGATACSCSPTKPMPETGHC